MRAWLAVVSVALIVSGQIVSGGKPYYASCMGLPYLLVSSFLAITHSNNSPGILGFGVLSIIVFWLIVYIGLVFTLVSSLIVGFTRSSNDKACGVVASLFAILALLTFSGLIASSLFPPGWGSPPQEGLNQRWLPEPYCFVWPYSFGLLSAAYAYLSKRRNA